MVTMSQRICNRFAITLIFARRIQYLSIILIGIIIIIISRVWWRMMMSIFVAFHFEVFYLYSHTRCRSDSHLYFYSGSWGQESLAACCNDRIWYIFFFFFFPSIWKCAVIFWKRKVLFAWCFFFDFLFQGFNFLVRLFLLSCLFAFFSLLTSVHTFTSHSWKFTVILILFCSVIVIYHTCHCF